MNEKPFEVSDETWQQLKDRFYSIYPKDSTLYEIDITRPHFVVWWKESNGLRHIDRVSNGNWNWGVVEEYRDEGGNIESENTPKVKELFLGIEAEVLGGQHYGHIYKDMYYWTCPF